MLEDIICGILYKNKNALLENFIISEDILKAGESENEGTG